MCDPEPFWTLVASAPSALTFAVAMGVLVSPHAYPGGATLFLAGLVGTLVLARLAKLLLVQLSHDAPWALRPRVNALPPSPGMPSSHVSIMAFALTALCADAARRPTARRVATALLIGVLATLVAISRVVTQCHSPLQVACGAVFGALLGLVYTRLVALYYSSRDGPRM